MNEQELRQSAERQRLKVEALDWLKSKTRVTMTEHADHCNYLDMTGHPAPCSCGFASNRDVKVVEFIRQAILKG